MNDIQGMHPNHNSGIWHNGRIVAAGNPGQVIERGTIVVQNGVIVWLGQDDELPAHFAAAGEHYDLAGQWVTPGLIDCHTHLVYGGNRADEFAARLQGATYEEIARAGGGILSTVRATRAISAEALFQQASHRIEALLAEGVMVIEVKSGYGLNLETERKMLQVARRLGREYPVTIYTTFLGLHALPAEYQSRTEEYVTLVCETMLPQLYEEGLIDAVDAFCENIGFTVAQSERLYQSAQRLGVPIKMHAEQLSNMGATRLAAKYQALSSDHLEYLNEVDIAAMKDANMVAVLLPGAFYFLREKQLPPIELLRQYQVPMAIATDSNPGTSPSLSLLLMLNMACTLFRMTVTEVLQGVTLCAAQALGKSHQHGQLAVGRYADFVVWNIDSVTELAYWNGFNRCSAVVRNGVVVRGVVVHTVKGTF